MSFTEPGRSLLMLGPSGSGKSRMLASALEQEGSGVVVLAQGADEIESYRRFFDDADFLLTQEDADELIVDGRLVSEKPYLFAAFDDVDFFPSQKEWKATGLSNAVQFMKLVGGRAKEARAAGQSVPWKVLGMDTISGLGELANNAICGEMHITHPPKARGDGGAEYYIGYKNKMSEACRPARALRGYGMHWIAACHVQMREPSDAFKQQDSGQSREQHMPWFTGSFREIVPAFFDFVLHIGVDKTGKHYALPSTDMSRQSRIRGGVLDPTKLTNGRIENDWGCLLDSIVFT